MKSSFRVERAEKFLVRLIDREGLSPQARLPSISRLASLAGVSFVTMWKAVQRLKEQGVLAGKRHAMSLVAGGSAETRAGAESSGDARAGIGSAGRRPTAVAASIERDLLNGVYRPGARLGSYKVLANKYGVCFATIKKAVELLIDKGAVKQHKKSIVVPRLTASRSSTRIKLIGIDSPHEIMALGTVGQEFLQWVEVECARAGIGLDIISFHVHDDEITYTDLATGKACDLRDSEDTAGYLYFIVAQVASQEAVYSRLQHFRKPVAVLDIVGIDYPRIVRDDANFRFFVATAALSTSMRVARFLMSIGHRRIAYFSPYHASRWSQLRLAGLQRAFGEAGCRDAVRPFVSNRITFSDYFSQGALHCDMAAFWKMLQEWQGGNPEIFGRHMVPALRIRAEDVCAESEIRREFEPLFQEALDDKSITAWIGANDLSSAYALDFLLSKGIDVPGGISVVGFDDSPEAIQRRMTSYNFNISAVAHAMLDYVLSTGGGAWPSRTKRIEIEGVIVERRTTAAPASSKRKR